MATTDSELTAGTDRSRRNGRHREDMDTTTRPSVRDLIAELAATGLPARDIAAAAYLSQKTVEYHLTRVYRKLGVRSKSELVFAFGGGLAQLGH